MSDQPAPEGDAASAPQPDAWSANGTHDMTEPAPEPGDAPTTEAPVPAITAETEPLNDDADMASAAPSDPDAFLHELVQAMRTTAAAERVRIAADVDRKRVDHLASIQARRESEAQQIRELADADLKAIDAWAEDERQRIDGERARRAEARTTDLATSIAEHGTRIDGEVERVEAAISAHRIEVDAFFAVLESEADPVAIAQHAGRRPSFPDLAETVAASADAGEDEAGEDAEAPEPVGVMDPEPGARLAASVAAWNAGSPVAAAAEAEPRETAPAEQAESAAPAPVAVIHGAHDNGPGTVLHAVPSGRPLSWLRRDRDASDHSGGDKSAG